MGIHILLRKSIKIPGISDAETISDQMWCETHPNSIPNVSGIVYNSHMTTTRCNWCSAEWEYDETIDICLTCNQVGYLMDLSDPSDTITL